jgi:hypothetical protein
MIQEKIRLATLFEFVSYSGHTLVSWAGAVGTGKAESGHMSCVGLLSVSAIISVIQNRTQPDPTHDIYACVSL